MTLHIQQAIEDFARKTGRKLHLEIEPGTYVVANAGALVVAVEDIVSTRPLPTTHDDTTSSKSGGHIFIKCNAGMTEILRPHLYGAQHPIRLVSAKNTCQDSGTSEVRDKKVAAGIGEALDDCKPRADDVSYVVVGHCCESSDIFTPQPGEMCSQGDTHEPALCLLLFSCIRTSQPCG